MRLALRRGILTALLLTVGLHPLHAEESEAIRPLWRVRGAHAAAPLAVVAPTIDGLPADLAWRAPSSHIGDITIDKAIAGSVRVTCDEVTAYLLIRLGTKQANVRGLEVLFGPAPFVRGRVRMGALGLPQLERWNGRAWLPESIEGIQIRTGEDTAGQYWEASLPREVLAAGGRRPGAPIAFQVRHHAQDTTKTLLDFSAGQGILLGAQAALLEMTVYGTRAKTVKAQVRWVAWNDPARAPALQVNVLRVDEPPIQQRQALTYRGTGEASATIALPPNAHAGQLRLDWPDQIAQSVPLRSPLQQAENDLAFLLPVLQERLRETSSPAVVRAILHLERGASEDALTSLADAVIHALPDVPATSAASSPPPTLPALRNQLQQWEQALMRFSTDNSPEPIDPATAALLELRVFDDLFAALAHENSADIRQELIRAYMIWRGWLAGQEPPKSGYLNPIWWPAVTARRATVLTRLIQQVLRHEDGLPLLGACLAEVVLCHRLALHGLETAGESTPLAPDLPWQLAEIARALPFLFDGAALEHGLRRIASWQVAAHAFPDGAGHLPGTTELLAMGTLFKLLDDRRSEPNLPDEARAPLARTLEYLARRVLPTARLPYFGAEERGFDENQLQQWAQRHFPERPELARFTPEAMLAVPYAGSAPETSNAAEYGGLYLAQSAQGRIAAAICAPPRNRFAPTLPPRIFGALLFANDHAELLVEPPVGHGAWIAPVTVQDLGPDLATLPDAGAPLPHTWNSGPVADCLTLAWHTRIPRMGPVPCRRQVLLAKGIPGETYVAVIDSLHGDWQRPEEKPLRVIQHLPLGDGARTALRLGLPDRQDVEHISRVRSAVPILRIARDLYAPGTSAFFLRAGELPGVEAMERRAVQPWTAIERRSQPLQPGRIYRIQLSDDRIDWLASAPLTGAISADLEHGRHMELQGDLALIRLDPEGLVAAFVQDTRRLSCADWTLELSHPASLTLERRATGSYAVRLDAPEDKPVTLLFRDQGPVGQLVKEAELVLVPHATIVFRPF